MIEKYVKEQELITNLLINEINNKKIVQAYMFCSNDINYILNYAKEFSKNLICDELDDKQVKNISKKIDENIYSELKIIEPINNMIKKEQIQNLKKDINKRPVEGNKIVYIIKNCEKLNKITANSMLKFIEDSSEDVIAIFLTDNMDQVIPTIKSRCQVLNFINSNYIEDSYNFLKKITGYNEENLDYLVDKSIDYILDLENNNINTFYKLKNLVYDTFVDKKLIDLFLTTILYFYYDIINYKIINKIKKLNTFEDKIYEVSEKNSLNKIIQKIYIIEQMKKDNNYNINQKLVFDRLILELCEV